MKIMPQILEVLAKCNKHYDMGQYLKDCEFIKSLVDDLVVMCDGIVDETQSSIINPISGIK